MRVTQHTIATNSLANLQTNLGRVSQLQEQMTSGKVINRPSDSPTGTVSALGLRGEIRTTEQYSRNANDAVSWLGTQDTTLTSINDVLQRVRVLTLQGSNDGALGPAAREALATEVRSLRETTRGLANTTFLGRPIFGGTTGNTQAFVVDTASAASPQPIVYQGDGGQVVRRVGADATVRVDTDGLAVFGPNNSSVFDVLDQIADHLSTGDTAGLSTDLGALDSATLRVRTALTEVGSRYNRAEAAQQAADDRVLTLRATLSGVEDIDLPHTIMDLQMQQMAYQTALGATAKALQPSLMDFLR